MRRVRLLWQLYPSYLFITLIALLAVTWYATNALHTFYWDHLSNELETRGKLIATIIESHFDPEQPEPIQKISRELGLEMGNQIMVVLTGGRVIQENNLESPPQEDFLQRKEIQTALKGETGISESSPSETNMMHVAVPLRVDGEIKGVVRTSVSTSTRQKALWDIYRKIAIGGIFIAVIAAIISLIISRKISHPLEEMKQLAKAFSRGELGYRLPVGHNEEIGSLAEAMNQMAAKLDDRFRLILQQRNEQEAILSSMVEGVLAVDTEERVISMNDATSQIFSIEDQPLVGRSLQETVRNTDLHNFVARTLNSETPIEGEIVTHDYGGRFLQAHGTPLLDGDSNRIGALVVLNDVTRLRRLENIRRDFVANVSHELKTPITSIKGFVETLLDGALNSPKDSERFLQIVAKQTDRLNNIIEDLLSLSRIEQDADKAKIELQKIYLRDVVNTAIECCEQKALEKNIHLNTSCMNGLQAKVNHPLLEQALVNLVDNAIKYSEPESEVRVSVTSNEYELQINVEDQGCGIEQKHLARLFERFYRVDKARSRKLGGTGLGLAIVKHIAQAHGGRITVESIAGKGSKFTLHIPVQ